MTTACHPLSFVLCRLLGITYVLLFILWRYLEWISNFYDFIWWCKHSKLGTYFLGVGVFYKMYVSWFNLKYDRYLLN